MPRLSNSMIPRCACKSRAVDPLRASRLCRRAERLSLIAERKITHNTGKRAARCALWVKAANGLDTNFPNSRLNADTLWSRTLIK
jgi:hypothetical protein